MTESGSSPRVASISSGRRIRYVGDVFAPAAATYPGVGPAGLELTTVADGGAPESEIDRLTLYGAVAPLVLAALWESGFALEAGPLSTWSN
jgi:hypothetical protein